MLWVENNHFWEIGFAASRLESAAWIFYAFDAIYDEPKIMLWFWQSEKTVLFALADGFAMHKI